MFTYLKRFLVLVCFFCLVVIGFGVKPARADSLTVFTVNSTDDVNDFVENSDCSIYTPTGGLCTLRAAIKEANAIAADGDVMIYIPEGFYRLSIAPTGGVDITSGDLDFQNANSGFTIKLIGTGAQPSTIDANQLDRVFEISPNVNVEMENIHIRSGVLRRTGNISQANGAGILNSGNLRLTKVILEENLALCDPGPCNMVIGGGAILNYGRIHMQDSMIFNNNAMKGSAIFNSSLPAYFFMKNSTIYDNYAYGSATIQNWGYMHIRNSTISGNTANNGSPSGIVNEKTLIVESSTIANSGAGSSIVNYVAGTVNIHDSILMSSLTAGNYNCENNADISSWVSQGNNIYSDATCPLTEPGDLSNTDPLLGPLGYYGGLTKTMPLLPGSPALDHRPDNCINIPESPVLPYEPNKVDQRHIGRSDGSCDTGAYELGKIYLPMINK